MSNEKQNAIGMITLFGRKPGDLFLTNLVDILSANTQVLHVICPFTTIKSDKTNVIFHHIKMVSRTNTLSKIFDFIIFQMKSVPVIIKLHPIIRHWIFYDGESFLLPMLIMKVLRKRTTLVLAGSLENEAKFGNKLLFMPLIVSKWISCHLANQIVIQSPCLIDLWGMKKYVDKINIAPKYFIDFTLFRIKRNFAQRQNKIGFVGRFGSEKGVLNFVEAISLVLKKNSNLDFVLVGDGPLMPQVTELTKKYNLNVKIKFCGWIAHEILPDYLNEFKLIVIPSYTEGLPNVMLEAMACGTPVLSTPVGAVPDIIEDQITGYIMEDNSPDCIARNILRSLNHPDLSQIAQNGRILVEKEFTFDRANEKCQVIFDNR